MRTVVVAIFAVLFVIPFPAHALGLPFGGRIVFVEPCPLSAGQVITVFNANPLFAGRFVAVPTTIPYPFFIDKPFASILGDYIPVPLPCGLPNQGTIIRKGTSAI